MWDTPTFPAKVPDDGCPLRAAFVRRRQMPPFKVQG